MKIVKTLPWQITSPNPIEGTHKKIAAKWSYQQNTDVLTHWVHINVRLPQVTSNLLCI